MTRFYSTVAVTGYLAGRRRMYYLISLAAYWSLGASEDDMSARTEWTLTSAALTPS